MHVHILLMCLMHTGEGKISAGDTFAGKISPLRKVAKFPPHRNFRGV